MDNTITEFEQECVAAGVKPQAALTAGEVHPTNWWRWKRGDSEPNTKTMRKARAGLDKIRLQTAS